MKTGLNKYRQYIKCNLKFTVSLAAFKYTDRNLLQLEIEAAVTVAIFKNTKVILEKFDI